METIVEVLENSMILNYDLLKTQFLDPEALATAPQLIMDLRINT